MKRRWKVNEKKMERWKDKNWIWKEKPQTNENKKGRKLIKLKNKKKIKNRGNENKTGCGKMETKKVADKTQKKRSQLKGL